MKEMKYFLEKEFNKVSKKFDKARQDAIGDVITELRGDLSNSIQFLTSIEGGIHSAEKMGFKDSALFSY